MDKGCCPRVHSVEEDQQMAAKKTVAPSSAGSSLQRTPPGLGAGLGKSLRRKGKPAGDSACRWLSVWVWREHRLASPRML